MGSLTQLTARLLCFGLAGLIVGGCAESPPIPLDAGETGTSTPRDTESTSDADTVTDARDTSTRVDGHDGGDADCGVCCPGSRRCADDATLETCLSDGTGWETSECPDGETCEMGACVPEPICKAGERSCLDESTALVCRPSGMSRRSETCASDESCVDGRCQTGSPNGTDCASDADCAGGKCRCGGESDGVCGNNPGGGICTRTCEAGGCDDGEFCLSSNAFPDAGYDHCVESCSESCSTSHLSCMPLPVADGSETTWKKGCYFDSVTAIGERCSSGSSCLGGLCLSGYFPFDVCTRKCDGGCPPGTACAELEKDTFYCSPLCGDGSFDASEPCPLEEDEDRIDIICGNRPDPDGDINKVCAAPDT